MQFNEWADELLQPKISIIYLYTLKVSIPFFFLLSSFKIVSRRTLILLLCLHRGYALVCLLRVACPSSSLINCNCEIPFHFYFLKNCFHSLLQYWIQWYHRCSDSNSWLPDKSTVPKPHLSFATNNPACLLPIVFFH